MKRVFFTALFVWPVLVMAQAPLPPAFQNVFPSPFQTKPVAPSVPPGLPAVTPTVITPVKLAGTDCFPAMPSARLDQKQPGAMPTVKGRAAQVDPGMVAIVKVCPPAAASAAPTIQPVR